MKNTLSTYRIQFNKDFTFHDFEKIKAYLKKLGVHTIYASPIFKAVPGSNHGYDVCDPNLINPEIGNESQLINISKWLKKEGMLWLQDIVPNHMAFHPKNELLMDLLEKGNRSAFADYFDTAFTCPAMEKKIMVPFLGEPLDDALDAGLIKIKWSGKRLELAYGDNCFPLNPSTYIFLLEKLKLEALSQEISVLDSIINKDDYAKKWTQTLSKISEAFEKPETHAEVQRILDAYTDNKELLSKLIAEQHYELCYWKETDKRINYRRFFTVNGLICLRMADEKVFQHHHLLIKKMIKDEVFDGLRIDHIDGLFEPSTYLKQLRTLAGNETYIIAEKILEKGEETPTSWPIQGNTGYDFLGIINNLFTSRSAEKAFTDYYSNLNQGISIGKEELAKKQYILDKHLAGELENLTVLFQKLQLSNESLDRENLKSAIGCFLVYMPVYRFYGESFPLNKNEQVILERVFEKIKSTDISFRKELEKLEDIFLKTAADKNDIKNMATAMFFKRCMQFSGPLMAKGVEDTLMYTDFRFIGHNEVGDHPSSFGMSKDEFHDLMVHRQQKTPLSINTTSTHDTKRGEDARARLNVLTALPEEWFNKVEQWKKINTEKRGELGIELKEEYFIYQCIIAHYPIDEEEQSGFAGRLKNYLQKAFREGKIQSDWANVNTKYEENINHYVDYLMDSEGLFLKDFKVYHQKIALYGVYNSLAQLGLKFTSPGVPDVYQGGELWDLSFVDPDNRRKIDYNLRLNQLENIESETVESLMEDYSSGKIKLWLTHQLFKIRKEEASVFSLGTYTPVEVIGKYQNNILAFIRRIQNESILVVSVINSTEILENQNILFTELDWEGTKLILPENLNWFNILQKNEGSDREILIKNLALKIPLAVLKLSSKDSRSAGILMHISSLPSKFGIGDLGPEAFRFVDFLKNAGQRYWQVLPIGPGASDHDISPYSTLCSMATNPLFISLELLCDEEYLVKDDLENVSEKNIGKIDYDHVVKIKSQLLKQAFKNSRTQLKDEESFVKFVEAEKDWLDDFSLFTVLRCKFQQAWFHWPEEYKFRDVNSLRKFSKDYQEEILEQKWYQFIFHKQWGQLKKYCSQNNIHLIGDIPFYVNHDSSDVWANPDLFSLHPNGYIDKMAGVPPDYFSNDGQLWGMPVYNWTAMKENGYKWWINRIKKNLSWYNLLRLDHFRAFYNYWEVPSTEKTAVNGEWRMGPANDFLNSIKSVFPKMPFIVEDLGDVNDEIFKLRDEFELPGMKVLQFAFGEDISSSAHILHQHSPNFIVYTGTHDNNTTKGWFRKDLSEKDKERIEKYLGKNIDESSITGSLIRMAYMSVAKTAIIPIQDLLNLDEQYRTNTPGTASDNWSFRISKDCCNDELAQKIKSDIYIYGRK